MHELCWKLAMIGKQTSDYLNEMCFSNDTHSNERIHPSKIKVKAEIAQIILERFYRYKIGKLCLTQIDFFIRVKFTADLLEILDNSSGVSAFELNYNVQEYIWMKKSKWSEFD